LERDGEGHQRTRRRVIFVGRKTKNILSLPTSQKMAGWQLQSIWATVSLMMKLTIRKWKAPIGRQGLRNNTELKLPLEKLRYLMGKHQP